MKAIKTLTERHPESVAQWFKAYGFEGEVNEKDLAALLKKHGNDPLPISDATGNTKQKLLDIAAAILNGASTIINNKAGVPINKPVYIDSSGNSEQMLETPRVFGINRTLFLALLALTVIALTIVIIKQK